MPGRGDKDRPFAAPVALWDCHNPQPAKLGLLAIPRPLPTPRVHSWMAALVAQDPSVGLGNSMNVR
jgi:hypothetical protein